MSEEVDITRFLSWEAIMRTNCKRRLIAVASVLFLGQLVSIPISDIRSHSVLGPTTARAQERPQVPSVLLLKRLAEVVDGHRVGGNVYVVASWEPPHHAVGVFPNAARARLVRDSAGGEFDVFGPYESERDPEAPLFFACFHKQSVMDSYCPPPPGGHTTEVDSLSIRVRFKNGQVQTFDLPTGTDAVFLNLSAIDKFALPYYTRVMGVDEAARLRREIVRSSTQQKPDPR